jgi:hypothetical protein
MLRLLIRIVAFCLAVSLMTVGSCHWIRASEEERFRQSLPPEYREGRFIKYEICDRLFGGTSYIFKLSPRASDRLRSAQKSGRIELLGHKAKWNFDGVRGLMCLRDTGDYNLPKYFDNSDTYARQTGPRHVDYFIPLEGIIVGGSDPR